MIEDFPDHPTRALHLDEVLARVSVPNMFICMAS